MAIATTIHNQNRSEAYHLHSQGTLSVLVHISLPWHSLYIKDLKGVATTIRNDSHYSRFIT